MKTTVKAKGGLSKLFNTNIVLNNLPFVVFSAVLILVYITIAQSGERKLMAINKLEKEVEEVRWEYMSLKKELMSKSAPSQLAKDLEGQVVFPEKGPRILKAPQS
ncbi:FtsL-like putative cell division protein [Saprospiraceae bacterium]|nr:FtsL-like putative cell division protein [Saprospiraceae bacterium]